MSGVHILDTAMRWDRRLWGVVFYGPKKRDPPILIGALWHERTRDFQHFYAGEPTRPLLFTTRTLARQWCRERNAQWAARQGEIVMRWHVKAVRVRETVRVETPTDRLQRPRPRSSA